MSKDTIDLEADELEAFIRKYMEVDRGVQRPKGIFSVLSGPREKQYQDTLAYFLDPKQPHGFGSTLLAAFLDCLGIHEFNLSGQHIEIDDEVHVAGDWSDGRIDLIITGGNSLSPHPQWGVFLELKVGAEEGTNQTTTYANAESWNVSWFETDTVTVDQLEDTTYVYLKRAAAEPPSDTTGTFETVDWTDVAAAFETELQASLYEYPNRSVIQVMDFIRSLKETEGMDSDIDADELNERLNLYFEHDRLIRQVEKANSQFESDFEDLSTYLTDNWAPTLAETFDFEKSGWTLSPGGNAKWQGIRPAYWGQDPLDRSSTIKLYYRHAPTTDSLRKQTLTFRLRLPPARNVHTAAQADGRSFNDVFTDYCTSEYSERLQDALDTIGVDDTRLGSAAALIEKQYPLDPHNLTGSYFEQLEQAVGEFCTAHTELPVVINEVFERTYQDVFDTAPEGTFPGPLPRRG